jgi:hypothetical protein
MHRASGRSNPDQAPLIGRKSLHCPICQRAMLFSTQINVATFAEQVQGKTGKNNKTNQYLPHIAYLLVK